MTRDELVEALLSLGIPRRIVADVPDISGADGLLVYGSRARGDALAGSDLDLIALAKRPMPSLSVGDVSLSFYTERQLSTGIGTLFGAHLRRDSKLIWDRHGTLARLVVGMGEVDPDRLFARALSMSALFTTPSADLPRYLEGMLRHARYLLRSCLYADAIRVGAPCFSVRELARRHNDEGLTTLLASRRSGPPELADLEDCLVRLRAIVGDFPRSRHGSLQATVVNEWERPGDLLSAAFLVLGNTGAGSMYAEVEKILL